MARRLVIVGAGMATAYLLQQLHGHRHDLRITVIGEEAQACYNRVLLSGVLAGENTEADLDMLGSLHGGHGVEFLLGRRVERVHLRKKTVYAGRGRAIPYDLLIFATGARVASPRLDCDAVPGVLAMRTLADVARLRAIAGGGQRAVVMGGGLLGLEAAHGLNELGCDTLVLHRRSWLMNRQLDREGGELLQRKLESRGMRFLLDDTVTGIEAPGGVLRELTLGDGSSLSCDLLVLAPGIAPSGELARDSGIDVDRGILIDEYMRTSDGSCYALGECTQLGQQCFGLVSPIREQAAVLARQLLGLGGAGFLSRDWPAQLKISGIEMFCAGAVDTPGEELVLRDTARGVYRRLVLRNDRLCSAILVGDRRDGSWYQELISSGTDVSTLRRQLIFGREVSDAARVSTLAA